MSQAINAEPGDRVIYLGPTLERPLHGDRLEAGAIGSVVYVVAPDGTDDGYAAVHWTGWSGRRLIRPDSEGKRWRRD